MFKRESYLFSKPSILGNCIQPLDFWECNPRIIPTKPPGSPCPNQHHWNHFAWPVPWSNSHGRSNEMPILGGGQQTAAKTSCSTSDCQKRSVISKFQDVFFVFHLSLGGKKICENSKHSLPKPPPYFLATLFFGRSTIRWKIIHTTWGPTFSPQKNPSPQWTWPAGHRAS